MKRLFIIIFSTLCFIIVCISCFIYFFNINDHSKWISEQLKLATGHDVRFEMLENNWLTENKLSVVGLSLYQQDKRIVYINRLDVEIHNLDLWSRHLTVKRLHLKGVELDINEADNNTLNYQQKQNEVAGNETLAWQKLHLSVIEITDMNATIHHQGKKLLIQGARVNLQDVQVVENKKFVTLPENINIVTDINKLEFNDANANFVLENIQLSSKTSLLKRQAELDLRTANVQLDKAGYPPFLLNSLVINSTFANSRLTLKDFSFNSFSGSLSAQAEALLAVKWLPKPDLKIEEIQLTALNAHDMHILIPLLPNFDKQSNLDTGQYKIPIESFVIQQMNLQNISLISEAEILPLTLKSADLAVNDFQVIKNAEFWSANAERASNADFSIAFEQLDWQETIVEGFSLSGNIATTEKGLQNLLR